MRKTITAYAALGNGIVDRPSSVTVKDGSNNIKAYTTYSYDAGTPQGTTSPQHNSVTGSRGLLTGVSAQANGSTTLYRTYTYYDTGTLSTSTDVSTSSTTHGALTTYNYSSTGNADCGNAFVTSITEPLSLSRSMTWDCNGGVMLSLTDENGHTSSTAYSGSRYTNYFWRPYSTTDQAGYITNYSYYLDSLNHPYQTESASATAFNGGNSIVDVLTTNDSFGRTSFHQTKQSPSASQYDTVATCYDSSGRVSLTTLAYSSAAASSTTTCPSTDPGTFFAYDALNRTTSTSDSGGGSTTYTYVQNDVLQTMTSPTQSKQLGYDALGRLKSVCEITSGTTAFPGSSCIQNNPGTGYLTTYSHDAIGDLTVVTQNANAASGHQTRSYVYDMLGRLTSETNPEMNNSAVSYTFDVLSGDASCGSYTSAGNMVKRADAAGNATCYSSYDALHRVGAITYPSSSTPSKYFVYDTATVNGTGMTNAKTRLAEAYTCIGGCSSKLTDLGFSYWPTGQTTDVWELTPHSGTNYYYHATSLPFPNGVPNTLSNLAGLPTITYSTDGEGRLGTASASSGQNPVTAIAYNPAGQVTSLTYGSSDGDFLHYDPSTGRMTEYDFTAGSTPQTETGSLQWNPNGALATLSIIDPFNASNTQTCAYSHDDLMRISAAACGGDNTLPNPDFESGNTGWRLLSAWSIINNTSNAQAGSWYLSGSSTSNTNAAANSGNWVPVSPNSVLRFGGWVERIAGTGNLWWDCEVVDASYTRIEWCPSAGPAKGGVGSGWNFYDTSITLPSNAAYVTFYAEIHGGGDTDTSLTTGYFDNATFTSTSSSWYQTFSYDPFGNISKNAPNGGPAISFLPNYDYTNYTNRIQSTPFAYNNNNGDMSADGSHSYSWDTENKLSTIDSGGSGGVCLIYDALGRMVEQDKGSACNTSPTSSTEIVYGPSGTKLALMNGSSLIKAFVPLPGGAQAVYNPSGLQYYRHPDWLGSSRLATTPTQTVYADAAYAPFGENYAQSGAQDLSFTGQNQDTESSGGGGVSGLYDFLYREHSPVQGRWLSPDPAGLAAANPADPQSWNRYAYLAGRPLSKVDPLGLDDCDPDSQWCDDPCIDDFWGCDPVPPGGGGGPSAPPKPPNPPQRTGGVWPNNVTSGLPQDLNTTTMSFGSLMDLSPGTQCGDFSSNLGECDSTLASNSLVNSGWGDVLGKAKNIKDGIQKWVDRGICAYAAYLCQKTIKQNLEQDQANQDPMKLLYQAEQCQAQGRIDCSDPEWNSIQQSGIQQDANCQKAAECALHLIEFP